MKIGNPFTDFTDPLRSLHTAITNPSIRDDFHEVAGFHADRRRRDEEQMGARTRMK